MTLKPSDIVHKLESQPHLKINLSQRIVTDFNFDLILFAKRFCPAGILALGLDLSECFHILKLSSYILTLLHAVLDKYLFEFVIECHFLQASVLSWMVF